MGGDHFGRFNRHFTRSFILDWIIVIAHYLTHGLSHVARDSGLSGVSYVEEVFSFSSSFFFDVEKTRRWVYASLYECVLGVVAWICWVHKWPAAPPLISVLHTNTEAKKFSFRAYSQRKKKNVRVI